VLSVGVATDPALIDDVASLADAMKVVYDELHAGSSAGLAAPVVHGGGRA
jgi:hypothetical protein